MKKIIAAIAALFITVGIAQADIDVDLGELGTVSMKTQLVPITKTVLDNYRPPATDENGTVIPWTNEEYITLMKEFILDRGWYTLVEYVTKQYIRENPPTLPDLSQYMVLTPPAP